MFHTYLMIEGFRAISEAHRTVYPVIFYKVDPDFRCAGKIPLKPHWQYVKTLSQKLQATSSFLHLTDVVSFQHRNRFPGGLMLGNFKELKKKIT